MKLKYIFSILSIILVCLISCKNEIKHTKIDLVKVKTERNFKLKLSSISQNLNWVKFETNSNSIFGEVTKLEFDQDRYFIFDQLTSNSIFIFNKNGKFVTLPFFELV